MGVRTKCGDSVSPRIPILLAKGQLREAEELLKQAVVGGLIARELATQWQERIDRAKEQQSAEPRRPPPPIRWEDGEREEPSRRTCWTELPNYPVCQALPEEYSFHSHRQALEAMKQRPGAKNLVLHNPFETLSGPCRGFGKHYNVRMNGERAGSIVCCPCCVENAPHPLEWTKCRIVW
jgi:hypothetical protein